MRFIAAATLLGALFGVASAHFHLQYPGPRGEFVQDNEPTFCDGYVDVTTNRTEFPLSNGWYSLESEHPLWILGVLISIASDPNNFTDFYTSSDAQQLVVQYFETSGEGDFCAPVNISASGISGISNGTNATLLFVFDGGDGELYQCADVTLVEDYTVPSSISCTNATSDAGVTVFTSGNVPTITGSSTSASATSTSAAVPQRAIEYVTLLLGVVGAGLALS